MQKDKLIAAVLVLAAMGVVYLGIQRWESSKAEQQPSDLKVVIKKQPEEQKPSEEVKQEPPPATAKVEPKEQKEEQDAEVKPEAKQAKKEEKPKEQKEEQKAKDAEVKPEAKQAKKEEKPKEQKQASANVKEQKQGEVFRVQIGAFRTEQNALKLANMAKEKGYNSEVVKDGNFHKIVLTLKSEDIKADIRKLKREFGDAILVK